MTRIAINGFGRIGRLVLRALCEKGRQDLEIVAINDLGVLESHAHLLRYDSVHGIAPFDVVQGDGGLIVAGHSIIVLAEPVPEKLPWTEHNIDIVLECTGRFAGRDKAASHLQAGAKRVLVSAPCDDADITVVYGVNHQDVRSSHQVVSNASCTTNCLAPVMKVLLEDVGFVRGHMTTVHSYTGDQTTVDTTHKDLRRARAAALSMIPTSTGAARAVGLVLPQAKSLIDGGAVRVPTANVSLIDLTFDAGVTISAQNINKAMGRASQKHPNILAISDLPLVSSDFNHHSASSIFDTSQTKVIDGQFGRVLSWYDNEWGFSHRMLDVASLMGQYC